MDEFGETPTIYVWPRGHVDGDPIPEDFHTRLSQALTTAEIEWENV